MHRLACAHHVCGPVCVPPSARARPRAPLVHLFYGPAPWTCQQQGFVSSSTRVRQCGRPRTWSTHHPRASSRGGAAPVRAPRGVWATGYFFCLRCRGHCLRPSVHCGHGRPRAPPAGGPSTRRALLPELGTGARPRSPLLPPFAIARSPAPHNPTPRQHGHGTPLPPHGSGRRGPSAAPAASPGPPRALPSSLPSLSQAHPCCRRPGHFRPRRLGTMQCENFAAPSRDGTPLSWWSR